MAALLQLPVEQLLAPVEAQEAGEEVARHLRQLVPLTAGHSFFTNRGIPEPNFSDACIDDAVAAMRSLLKLSPDAKVTHDHLFQLFAKIGVILVPVFWGGDREGHQNAMSVYLPDSRTVSMRSPRSRLSAASSMRSSSTLEKSRPQSRARTSTRFPS